MERSHLLGLHGVALDADREGRLIVLHELEEMQELACARRSQQRSLCLHQPIAAHVANRRRAAAYELWQRIPWDASDHRPNVPIRHRADVSL